jgi:quinoprotein glucose dehydrogenase/quinate dehydrogenase (quinone)
MWGATPLDQLWCRINFRSRDYRGDFTPPSTRGSISYPGQYGAINWGSVAIDEGRQLMIVNASAIPQLLQLVPRPQMDALLAKRAKSGVQREGAAYSPMKGTPYGVIIAPFLSPLGIPCSAPPWGKLMAIDLKAQKVLWQRPLGTSQDNAPLGIRVPGIFNIGGSVVTRGGVIFIGATMDHYLRAFELSSGRELWKGRLASSANATPTTFQMPDGRQYVAIAAGGHEALGSPSADHIYAFALPAKK